MPHQLLRHPLLFARYGYVVGRTFLRSASWMSSLFLDQQEHCLLWDVWVSGRKEWWVRFDRMLVRVLVLLQMWRSWWTCSCNPGHIFWTNNLMLGMCLWEISTTRLISVYASDIGKSTSNKGTINWKLFGPRNWHTGNIIKVSFSLHLKVAVLFKDKLSMYCHAYADTASWTCERELWILQRTQ